ncbi:TPA: shikimate dehydrogenase [Streptococcus agalactiae]
MNSLNGETLLTGLIANPARHSLSPLMWNTSFQEKNMNYAYLTFEVEEGKLTEAVRGVRALGIRGVNVSMPFKQSVIPLLDDLSPQAKLVGAVNTIVNQGGTGRLVGHMTDGIGCFKALAAQGFSAKNKIITIAGIGGSGKAVAVQAAMEGVAEIRLFNRNSSNYDKVIDLSDKIKKQFQIKVVVDYLENKTAFKDAIRTSHFYIDATSLGMRPLDNYSLINDPEILTPNLVVVDLVYKPKETALLRFVRQNGVKHAYNGLGMLIYQGAEAFQLITNQEMPISSVERLLQTEN